MLNSHFKVAIRSFRKDKLNSIINLGSLSVGLACVFMIMAYINYELSYDKSYSNSSRIYRVVISATNKAGIVEQRLSMPNPLAYTLQHDFPDIESVSKMQQDELDLQIDNRFLKLKSKDVDTSFLHIFNFPFLRGNPDVLKNENDMVLTESAASRLDVTRMGTGTGGCGRY